ncbi:MAG: replicative DNA helicase [Robiginitomaculum sp.]|nr:replicative DNA helicase [Robiginitomaculum sp.]
MNDETIQSAPHDLEAEQAVIGAVLFDNEVYFRIGEFLQPSHFYDKVHGWLYEEIIRLIQKNALADGMTMRDKIKNHEGAQEIGGVKYLATLMANAGSSANAPQYARLIHDLSVRRELMRIGEDIVHEAKAPPDGKSGAELLETAEESIFNLAETGGISSGFTPFEKSLEGAMTMAAAAFKRDGGMSGISTGLIDMDKKLGGLHPSDLLILAGRPGMGKSALATNIAFHVAKNYKYEEINGVRKTKSGGVVAFFSLEMSADQLATRLLSEHTRISSSNIRKGEIQKEDFDSLVDAAKALNEIPLFIDDTGGLPVAVMAARARRLKRTAGSLDLIVVDYLQLLTANTRRNDGRVQEVSQITQTLKTLAKELNVPVLALSQLSRAVESRSPPKPQLADLRESGSIEQDADVVMFVYRPAYYEKEPERNTPEHEDWQIKIAPIYNLAEVDIAKQRHGPTGRIELTFEPAYTKFGNRDSSGKYDDTQH